MTLSVEFDSVRQAVWGDFYAKCGGQIPNQVWNSGFLAADPVAPVANGSIDNHLLVPDSVIVPEPATMLLMGAGLAMLAVRKRRSVDR